MSDKFFRKLTQTNLSELNTVLTKVTKDEPKEPNISLDKLDPRLFSNFKHEGSIQVLKDIQDTMVSLASNVLTYIELQNLLINSSVTTPNDIQKVMNKLNGKTMRGPGWIKHFNVDSNGLLSYTVDHFKPAVSEITFGTKSEVVDLIKTFQKTSDILETEISKWNKELNQLKESKIKDQITKKLTENENSGEIKKVISTNMSVLSHIIIRGNNAIKRWYVGTSNLLMKNCQELK